MTRSEPVLAEADARPPYVLVAGSGRSGSNNLLDIFDCHPDTVCRSEPRGLPGADFNRLPKGNFPQDYGPDFLALWRDVIATAPARNSARDHFIALHKTYFRRPALTRVFQPLFGSARFRRSLALVAPAYRMSEWPTPRLYVSHTRLALATPVLKVASCPGWIGAVIGAEPRMRIVHNIRDPRGFIQSWWNRYLPKARGGATAVYARNLETLPVILDHYGAAWPHGEAFSPAALIESELWRWRYFNEELMRFESYPGRYMRIYYDDVVGDRTAAAERVFAFSGLSMDPGTRTRIASQKRTLFKTPHASALPSDVVDTAIARTVAEGRAAEAFARRETPVESA